jgi:hypothetical protein
MKTVYILSIGAALAVGASILADEPSAANNAGNPADPTLPVVSVNASDPTAFRGLSSGAFLIHRNDTNGDLNVNLKIGGTAENGVDYTALPTSVKIPAGFFSVGLVVSPLGGGASAPDQTVVLTVDTNADYQVGRPGHATVEIEANVYEDQPPIISLTSPADNTSIPAHSDLPITADASDPNDSITKVSFYANDKFLGSSKTAPYSITWSNVPPGTFGLFARAEDQFGKSTLSTAVHVTATNPPPSTATVILSAPGAGSSFDAGANITLEATVTDTNPIKTVSFYAGDTLLGTDDTAPYSFTWNNVPPGHYTLRAKAAEVNGSSATSEGVKIAVTNSPPKVSITSPANNSTVSGPQDLKITADATDSDGNVSKVTFYGDSKVLGSSTTAPYSITWSNMPPGKHIIVAAAMDSFGGYGTAATIVTVTNPPPIVTLTSPQAGATFPAPASIDLKADASDTDGVQYVSFWSGDHRVGVVIQPPYQITLTKQPAGSYTFRAHAVDKFGQVTVSDPVKVTVTKP